MNVSPYIGNSAPFNIQTTMNVTVCVWHKKKVLHIDTVFVYPLKVSFSQSMEDKLTIYIWYFDIVGFDTSTETRNYDFYSGW